jgi:DNA-directed RNA polymerase subunit RPC12/RpoP
MSKTAALDYLLENFQEYWGNKENVEKIISDCDYCGSKMIFTHLPDYKNLMVQETARCPECGEGQRKRLHIIN